MSGFVLNSAIDERSVIGSPTSVAVTKQCQHILASLEMPRSAQSQALQSYSVEQMLAGRATAYRTTFFP